MRIGSLLSALPGCVIYIYLDSVEKGRQFLQEAEAEGFTFGDGAKPTSRHPSDLFALGEDKTLCYVGFVGHMAYKAAHTIGNKPLVKIEYR